MDPAATTITVLLGDEFDDPLRDILRAVLRDLGASTLESGWGVGGSQEVETAVASIDGRAVTVEAETYLGLTITGAPDLVNAIAAWVAQRRRAGPASDG